ncbi:His/Gly/Thr/Pro-type tRNA ligase C-terminal domain-containing protein [Pseudomonas sp. N3-W]|uniref:His/Gly/Thr/Pro-type tRNA ligase C-terminal domain-containing protein n=1 Tax=Pseudomonas fungipugnans TaxID=3024217 RepID=A0ABT6QPV5_9PSED|nr:MULTISPECIES: His/Gly/Thr/Pro-type tRNA ligase C-terminal domain-containing protein [unclassified Pseudomonas]MDI2592876.1 His/Gly/Thr/Pro-type tRNA ligase C-terminal domain-containing protein [Pseudomonas sp. 681]UWF49336.1 His/Gly/Thr/Pro-type tRNA ligase C-terminal domain-containing protein [Pseudomonas sp. N3-W]
MIKITLPNGTLREYDQPLSVFEVAASIGFPLAKAAVAGRVDGVLVDCGFMIEGNARVSIVTPREPDGLEILRRSCTLMLGMAVRHLQPAAQCLAGSAWGDGFFYEFATAQPLTFGELPQLEARMQAIAATNHPIRPRLKTAGRTLYQMGDYEIWSTGPHVPTTAVMQAFSLNHINGTSRQRIYGTCWSSKEELEHWQAPQQAMVLTINERQAEYGQSVTEILRRSGLRATADLRDETIGYKIREHSLKGVPYLLVVGEKEQVGGFVSVRSGGGESLGEMPVVALGDFFSSSGIQGA